ncbi:MAG: hypothetical protein ACFE8A_14895 [Candidatus Hodarchaeota archaeon]
MRDFPTLEIKTDVNRNELFANINKVIQFNVLVKNLGSKQMPRVYITLNGPPEVKLIPKRRSIGSIPRGKLRKMPFKIKSRVNGLYCLEVVVTRNQDEIAKIPIALLVGTEIQESKPEQSVQQPQLVYDNLETQQNPQEGSKFCPLCFAELNVDAKTCTVCKSEIN